LDILYKSVSVNSFMTSGACMSRWSWKG